uniref:Poly (ADP-ribose) polymerase family, member 12a n=1 Tax=Astyanax mexicanus TaxID=7994 RepID=A0A8B9KNE5_ASTMX
MSSSLSAYMYRSVCQQMGSVDFKTLDQMLRQHFTIADEVLLDVLNDFDKFLVVKGKEKRGDLLLSPDSEIIAKTDLRLCQNQSGPCVNCHDLHLCRYYVCGNCTYGAKCHKVHAIDHSYNTVILNKAGLQFLGKTELFQLLLQNDPSLLPEVCSHYNKGNGEHGSCKFPKSCKNLHLCQHFLQDDCKFAAACKRAHSFDATAMKILNARGLSPENIHKLCEIDKNRQHSSNSVSEADRSEICLYFVRQGCSFKGIDTQIIILNRKCVRVHHDRPYKWEVLAQDGVTWTHMPNEEDIERAYCNPANEKSSGPQPVNFSSMTCGGASVRRLSTASSVTKPPHFILTTEWLWYWEDEKGQWNEYGHGDDGKNVSSVSSKVLENLFLAEVETELTFSVGNQNYVLNLKDMCQQNIKYKTKRKVRRRPQFVSAQDVKGKLKR